MTVQGLTDHSWTKCIKCSFFPSPPPPPKKNAWSQVKSQPCYQGSLLPALQSKREGSVERVGENPGNKVASQVYMRQNSTNSNKKWKQSWLKGLLVNGSILLPTFPMYACKSKGEFAIRSGPTVGLTPCTPLWLGQYTSTLLSQLWLWFRSFNFSVLKFITAIIFIVGSWLWSWGFSSGPLVL